MTSLYLSAGLGLGMGGGAAWSPSMLFANSELGAWHDFRAIANMAQASDGSTPITADGDPVGYAVDLSGKGNHAIQATAGTKPAYSAPGRLYFADGSDYLTGIANPKWLHDGTGGYLAMSVQAGLVADPNALFYLAGTRGSAIVNGLSFGYDDRTASSHNDATLVSIATKISTRAESALPANTKHFVEVLSATGANGVQVYVDGVLASQSTLTTPSTLDCSFGLNIGAGGNGDSPMRGYFYSLLTINRAPTAAERAALMAYYA